MTPSGIAFIFGFIAFMMLIITILSIYGLASGPTATNIATTLQPILPTAERDTLNTYLYIILAVSIISLLLLILVAFRAYYKLVPSLEDLKSLSDDNRFRGSLYLPILIGLMALAILIVSALAISILYTYKLSYGYLIVVLVLSILSIIGLGIAWFLSYAHNRTIGVLLAKEKVEPKVTTVPPKGAVVSTKPAILPRVGNEIEITGGATSLQGSGLKVENDPNVKKRFEGKITLSGETLEPGEPVSVNGVVTKGPVVKKQFTQNYNLLNNPFIIKQQRAQ